ncbi:SoxR reducing system RseC family protein [Marinobacter sp.]|uniref:SoxR reducing system RseC family protein n=1 Tax=Marinobacter sp. TaxID=50741 RepID=UPI002B478A62|nr:SoxR reducing system RseC family protein [Marinobacter sp.]HKK54931.1 SoxR reducing system RseC family protein [Marinobacter sp.]
MIRESGRVIALKDDKAWVQTIRTSACESCSARSGCGQRVLARASSGRANQILVINHLNARVGDQVTVAIAESALISASLLVYGLPLVLMILGAVTGQHWLPHQDAGAIAGAVAGLVAGFGLAGIVQSRSTGGYQPALVDILPGTPS